MLENRGTRSRIPSSNTFSTRRHELFSNVSHRPNELPLLTFPAMSLGILAHQLSLTWDLPTDACDIPPLLRERVIF